MLWLVEGQYGEWSLWIRRVEGNLRYHDMLIGFSDKSVYIAGYQDLLVVRYFQWSWCYHDLAEAMYDEFATAMQTPERWMHISK